MGVGLPISRLINVTVNLEPTAAPFANFNTLLIIGSSNVIDVTSRIRYYQTLAEVATDFGTSAPEYLSAVLWYEQNPQPTNLAIGRWAQSATSGQLYCAPLSAAEQALANFTAISSGGLVVTVNGVPFALSGINLSAASALTGVAGDIQAALRTATSSTETVVWNGTYDNFIFSSATTGPSSSVGFLGISTAVGSIAFGSTQPTASDTVVVDGTSIAFVSGTPSGSQVKIGGSVAITVANLLAFLVASVDVNIAKMTYTSVGNTVYCQSKITGTTGNAYTLSVTGSTPPTVPATLSGGSANDIAALLFGFSTSSGAYVANGVAAETALACVTLMDVNYGSSWYAVTVLGSSDADSEAIAPYIEASNTPHYFGVSTQEAGVIVTTSTTDIAYILSQLQYNRTGVQWSSSNAYSIASYLARILTTNWTANNSTITLMYKQEPGIVAETLNVTQITALENKNANVFVNYQSGAEIAIIERGTSTSGQFTDTVIGADWLANQIQIDVFNLLYTSPTKVPQTDAGNALISATIASACDAAVNNGLLAPGTWTEAGFGQLSEGDFLKKGYYIYAPPIASQSPSDRAARKSVAFQVAAKLAGAVQTVSVLINVNA